MVVIVACVAMVIVIAVVVVSLIHDIYSYYIEDVRRSEHMKALVRKMLFSPLEIKFIA